MAGLIVTLLIIIAVLLIWNVVFTKKLTTEDSRFHEVNARLNYLAATGAVIIAVLSYFGFNYEQNLSSKANEFIVKKNSYFDSTIASKNILKASIFIVNDLEFVENKEYRFDALKTIDNQYLPKFLYPPKLIINTSTGENLRIKNITPTAFVLSRPLSKNTVFWAEEDNPNYPKVVTFDVWIADYRGK